MDRNERLEVTQQRRAEQFAACVYVLGRDPSVRGAEALFDQVLTNGLALIVAHEWPGKESNDKGFMLPASRLLGVIEGNGIPAADGVTRVLHDPAKPEFFKSTFPFKLADEEELVPNFTEVRGPILKCALKITQEVRHARKVSEQPPESLSEEHLEALNALGDYPEVLHEVCEEAVGAYGGSSERE